jgi:predicted HAD superfamily phosphohydrolase
LPLNENLDLQALYKTEAIPLVGAENFGYVGHSAGSTDMGDVEHIMPGIHPYSGGAVGTGHGNDYLIKDYNVAVLNPAKAMAMLVVDLLADGAVKAKEVLSKSKPKMTKPQYLSFMDKLMKEELYEDKR